MSIGFYFEFPVLPANVIRFDQPSICLAGNNTAFGDDIVIVVACRTPICKSKRGGFKDTHANDLLAPVLKALIDRTKVNPSEVGDIVVCSVLACATLRATQCRMTTFYVGFPDTVPIRTVNRQCSSGLQAVADIAASIKAGFYDIGIGAGLESMKTDGLVSRFEEVNPKTDSFAQARDCILPMGITSENVAQRYGITRQKQDQAIVESHRWAATRTAYGKFKEEIILVAIKIVNLKIGEEKAIIISEDDGIRPDTNIPSLAKLKPAGNASQVSEGADRCKFNPVKIGRDKLVEEDDPYKFRLLLMGINLKDVRVEVEKIIGKGSGFVVVEILYYLDEATGWVWKSLSLRNNL
ncbi:3-ketoacyl CoA thiolase 1, peroxisomal-like [Hibiscus syriacus]|uniref:3-ketoacyl CoA thiolase 1, peroxisomal-like n=1 Tax=Hibiscus syriacus TaxID=106335 RepID=UPI0019223D08|nr:3-ketoacyl CoA thiolase 1, peroxisomal-like [Hibiscus syriacus]